MPSVASRMAAAVGLGVAALAGVRAQQRDLPVQPPILRASVDQVVVDVVVTDQHGGVVPGLTADDFEVFERGERQAIATFSAVSLPLVRSTLDTPPPRPVSDVRSNLRRPEGRVYVLVLDDYHVSVSRSALVQQAARDFVARQVQPGDLVAVVTTTGLGGAFQDFTEDPALVSAAVNRFVGRLPGQTAALQTTAEESMQARARAASATAAQQSAAAASGADLSISQAATVQAEQAFGARNADPMATRRNSTAIISDGAVPDNDDAGNEALERGRVSLRTLRIVSSGLASLSGRRKAVLFFSEGLAMSPRQPALVQELEAVMGAAARANVTLYAIDPRGLDLHMGSELLATGVSPSAQLQQGRRLASDMLRSLAEGTGGTAAVETNAIAPMLERIADESSHYYLLGYAPTDTRRDGRYRSIDVRVKRSGLRVSARKGYVAPDDRPHADDAIPGVSTDLSVAVRQPLSTIGLPLSASAVALPSEFDNVTVTIEIGPDAIPFDVKDGERVNDVELVILPVGVGGTAYPMVRGRLTLRLTEAEANDVRKLGLRAVERVTLPAGTFQLRIAAREAGRGALGSVICDVVVPDASVRGLAMTPLIVSTTRARRVPSANRDDRLARALGGGPPTTARTFGRDETISAYAEVTDVGASTRRDVELVTIVRDARDREVVHSARPNAAERVEPGRSFPYAIDLPLRTLAPGRYVLRVEARATGTPDPVARELRFEVTAPAPRATP